MLSERDTEKKSTLLSIISLNMTFISEYFGYITVLYFINPCIKNKIREFIIVILPDDSGSTIFILSSLSVVENKLGLRDGTGAIRKQLDITTENVHECTGTSEYFLINIQCIVYDRFNLTFKVLMTLMSDNGISWISLHNYIQQPIAESPLYNCRW